MNVEPDLADSRRLVRERRGDTGLHRAASTLFTNSGGKARALQLIG